MHLLKKGASPFHAGAPVQNHEMKRESSRSNFAPGIGFHSEAVYFNLMKLATPIQMNLERRKMRENKFWSYSFIEPETPVFQSEQGLLAKPGSALCFLYSTILPAVSPDDSTSLFQSR